MTIRNLDFLFKPKSVALIGASKRPGSLGAVVARNPLRSGFDVPVSPKHGAIERVLTYPDVPWSPLSR
jgi:acetyltransferase